MNQLSDDELQVNLDPKPWNISGYTKLPAGQFFQDLNIDGMVVFDGDFECDNLHGNGLARAKGNLLLHGNLSYDGAFIGKGNLQCEENVSISGLVRVQDKILVQKSLRIGGSFKSGNDISITENASFEGSTKIKGNLIAGQNVTFSGRTIVKGNINARTIKFSEQINPRSFFHLKSKIYGNLYASETLELHNCIIKGKIEAKNVILGENTIVKGTITYSKSISKASKVRISQTPIQKALD
ncbi:MAG: polymer-forming cytoskeletal protein [Promethearchaeota archaeon]|nr:MAG: polymer-forming cytoskeletal protein [Candidatus Lokiarchaeota archaeon]